jgi:hypothetical protein
LSCSNTINSPRDPKAWKGVEFLLDALGTRGTSDDKTDNESECPNPDSRFKTLRRVDTGFLNQDIADIWASVETYPSSLCPSRGNRSYRRISKAKSVNKQRTPLPGLPANFYNTEWLRETSSRFRGDVKTVVPLPVLVGHLAFMISGPDLLQMHKVPYDAYNHGNMPG